MGKKGRSHSHQILLKQARRIEIRRIPPPPVTVYKQEDHPKPKVFTFNWNDERVSPLVPRLLKDGECPQFTEILRDYVNCTARGVHPDPELSKELDQFPSRERTNAFREGIRRWHTFLPGKERL